MEKIYWDEYPRPQMKREGYMILNGLWKLNGSDIVMPFPPQSTLSCYKKVVDDLLIYEKRFSVPKNFIKKRVILHFGAVDQIAKVWLNDKFLGTHKGGYLPFSFDITECINTDGENYLKVEALDTLSVIYPYGKQCKNRGGMWYTPVSGIWKTVWIETVPENYVKNIKIKPDLEGIDMELEGVNGGFKVVVDVSDAEEKEELVLEFAGNTGRIQLGGTVNSSGKMIVPQYWTPDNPKLYSMQIITETERIESYFALRTVEIKKVEGTNRVCLNGKPVFMNGVLDQGYYQDGIYLPESQVEFEKDILRMKELGFNTLRKHIKIEPEAFYYYCDKLGMLVIQDMVNSGAYSYMKDTVIPTLMWNKKSDITNLDKDSEKERERKQFFEKHMKDTIDELYNHPCIVAYTIFNEGWGQFDSDRMYELAKSVDDSRLYDSTSGWFAQNKSDFDSKHVYFINRKLQPCKKNELRPMLLSECGGYTYLEPGHVFNTNKSYGYGKCKDTEQLTERILKMYEKMVLPAIENGLCGCIYTQLSDVEDEINGMYTYDRVICKVNIQKISELSQKIYKLIGKYDNTNV